MVVVAAFAADYVISDCLTIELPGSFEEAYNVRELYSTLRCMGPNEIWGHTLRP